MDNVIDIDKSVAGLKKITLRAYLGKTQGKLIVRPVKDRMTQRLKGVKLLTEDEAKKTIHVVTHDTERVIEDYTVIDLENKIDAIDWEWMKYCPEIFGSLEECLSNHHLALFYVENLEKDTEIRIKKRHIKRKAFKYLEEAGIAKMSDIARLLGTDATTFTKLDLEDYLGEIAETAPARIVDAFEDKMVKVKLFLYGLTDKKIVMVDQDGVYKWNNHILGTTEKSALDWLMIPDNRMYVKRLTDELYPQIESNLNTEFNLASDNLEKPLNDEELEETKKREAKTAELEQLSEEDLKERYKSVMDKYPHSKAGKETIINKIIEKELEEITL